MRRFPNPLSNSKDHHLDGQFRFNPVFWSDTTVKAKVGFLHVEVALPTVMAPDVRIAFHKLDTGGIPLTSGPVRINRNQHFHE